MEFVSFLVYTLKVIIPLTLKMKSIFLLILILLLSINFTQGQSIIGVTVGYHNSTFFDIDETPHYSGAYKSPSTYCITAFLKNRKERLINVGLEFSLVKKVLDLQASYGGQGSWVVRDVHFNLNYLYFSLFPELSLGKKFTFNFCAGHAFGFLINSSISGSSYSNDIYGNKNSWTDSGDATTEFNSFEIKLFANIGLEIPIKNKFKVCINNFYSRGITNATTFPEFVNSNDVSVTLGIIYRLENFSFSNILPKPNH